MGLHYREIAVLRFLYHFYSLVPFFYKFRKKHIQVKPKLEEYVGSKVSEKRVLLLA